AKSGFPGMVFTQVPAPAGAVGTPGCAGRLRARSGTALPHVVCAAAVGVRVGRGGTVVTEARRSRPVAARRRYVPDALPGRSAGLAGVAGMAAFEPVEATLMARVLALTSRLPYPPTEGHQLRAWHLLKALASRHDVTLMSFLRGDDAPDEARPLRAILQGLETFPIPSEHSRVALGQALL